ncbi:hypothetical protein GGI07_005941, partial [Coemansia sp. Benny D115]
SAYNWSDRDLLTELGNYLPADLKEAYKLQCETCWQRLREWFMAAAIEIIPADHIRKKRRNTLHETMFTSAKRLELLLQSYLMMRPEFRYLQCDNYRFVAKKIIAETFSVTVPDHLSLWKIIKLARTLPKYTSWKTGPEEMGGADPYAVGPPMFRVDPVTLTAPTPRVDANTLMAQWIIGEVARTNGVPLICLFCKMPGHHITQCTDPVCRVAARAREEARLAANVMTQLAAAETHATTMTTMSRSAATSEFSESQGN